MFFMENYTDERHERDRKTERVIFDILHYALLSAEKAVKIMKQEIKSKEEKETKRLLGGD